jgi:hypothetical protein
LVGDKTHRISIFRNLLANGNRNPRIDGNVSALVVNNLCHNSVGTFSVIGGYPSGRRLPSFVTFIGNVGIPGNNTMEGKALVGTNKLAGGSKLYFSNNLYKGEIYSGGKEFLVDIPPVPAKGISIVDCLQVEDLILQTAGARPAERDLVDSRIIRQVRARTGKIIDTPAEVGGWPDMAVNFRQIILPSQPQADDDGDGYTNIEEVLHRMSDRILRHF